MPISAEALEAMMAAGATAEMIVAAVKAQEAVDKERIRARAEADREELKSKRANDTERKRRQRARQLKGDPPPQPMPDEERWARLRLDASAGPPTAEEERRARSAKTTRDYRARRAAQGLPFNFPRELYFPVILKRDGDACVYCETIDGLDIDHFVPISQGGTDDEGNLGLACRSCNGRKSARTPEQARMPIIVATARVAYENYLASRTSSSRVTECDAPIPLPSSPTPPLTNPLTPFDDVDVRARSLLDLAKRLADQTMEILGVDRATPPRYWRDTASFFEQGLAERGWRADVILVEVRKIAASFAKRVGERHPESCGYLTKPIDMAHARHQRELALVTPIATADPAAVDAARAAQVWLHRDDERFKAWDAHLVATRGRGLPTDGKGGWHVASDWPPGHPRASEAA